MRQQYTVTTKPAERPQGQLVYRGFDLGAAQVAAVHSLSWPAVPRAVIYIDRRDEDTGTFAFTGESWGWADIDARGETSLHSVEAEAANAARRTADEEHARFRALLRHVEDIEHRALPKLGEDVRSMESQLINIAPGLAIEALVKVHRMAHPSADDPYHDVKVSER